MKIFILTTAIFLLFAACNNEDKIASKGTTETSSDSIGIKNATGTRSIPNSSGSLQEIITAYMQIKNGLVADDGAAAAIGGDNFVSALQKIDSSSISGEKKRIFEDIADDAKEMAEHIGKSANKLEHQREHFDMLSKDVYDMVKTLGTGQPLYLDFCPMYNDKKGASWLSETKDIKNPYMGKKMTDCGTVKEEIK